MGASGPDCDWQPWFEIGAYAGSRPTNELLWLRDLVSTNNHGVGALAGTELPPAFVEIEVRHWMLRWGQRHEQGQSYTDHYEQDSGQ